MKTIGIISDTHSYWDDRYAIHFADCDEIWHAGDIGNEQVLDRLADVAPVVRAVWGNADGQPLRRRLKETELFTVEGVKVIATDSTCTNPKSSSADTAISSKSCPTALWECSSSIRAPPDGRDGRRCEPSSASHSTTATLPAAK